MCKWDWVKGCDVNRITFSYYLIQLLYSWSTKVLTQSNGAVKCLLLMKAGYQVKVIKAWLLQYSYNIDKRVVDCVNQSV